MSRAVTSSLRLFQALLAIAILGLSAFVTRWYASLYRPPPPTVGFLVFAAGFSLLSAIYLELAPRRLPRAAPHLALAIVETLNAVFFFAGFIAYAVFLAQLTLCLGNVCAAGRADCAVAAIAFCLWAATAIIATRSYIHSRKSREDESGIKGTAVRL